MRVRRVLCAAMLGAMAISAPAWAADPAAIPLYAPGVLPQAAVPERTEKLLGELRVRNVSQPSLTLVAPAPGKANGAAVIVAPGGGFFMLSWESEGTRVAQRLAEEGFTAFILKYRLDATPDDAGGFTREFMARMADLGKRAAGAGPPLTFAAETPASADAAEAVRLVRRRAAEWGVDPRRVGFVGFSAGGMTAANVATGDPTGRPDFVGIVYGALHHPVPKDAPPAFIATAADDPLLKDAAVPMFQAWRAAGRPAELHLFEKGGHGFGMNVQGATSDHWFEEFVWWLRARGVAGKTPKP
ncbi:MAG TPA: alpha/beta hydrolase [Phenylobacterium sp.]